MKDNDIIVPSWLFYGLIVIMIVIQAINSSIESIHNQQIKQLKSQNQLYSVSLDSYKKYPKWLLNAYDNCVPDEVPSTFMKECTIFNLKSSTEFDKQIERSK